MIQFLLKGILRDHSRSLFPLLTVAAGALLIVAGNGWIAGVSNDMIWASAIFSTGHVKVMTNAYAKDIDLIPNDLAILGAEFAWARHWLRKVKERSGDLVDMIKNGLS